MGHFLLRYFCCHPERRAAESKDLGTAVMDVQAVLLFCAARSLDKLGMTGWY
jgi:hypothetical protein